MCVRLLVRVCARVRAVCVRAVCVVWFPAARRGSNKFCRLSGVADFCVPLVRAVRLSTFVFLLSP